MDTTEFWKENAHLHIKPATGEEFPEGWDVRPYLAKLCDGNLIMEVGCGEGRLSAAFQPEQYLGVDISPKVLEIAKSKNKNHNYFLHNHGDRYPEAQVIINNRNVTRRAADVRFVYTVLLHIDDDCIDDFIENLCESTDTVVVAEIMGRKWRRSGDPPVFNRETDEYITLFENCGFELDYHNEKPYERYADTNITFLRFRRR